MHKLGVVRIGRYLYTELCISTLRDKWWAEDGTGFMADSVYSQGGEVAIGDYDEVADSLGYIRPAPHVLSKCLLGEITGVSFLGSCACGFVTR